MALTHPNNAEYAFDGMGSGKTTKLDPDLVAIAKINEKTPRMLHDYALVRPDQQKVGNLIIPEGAGDKVCFGLVVCIGKGTTVNGIFVPTEVKAGDRVRFGKWAHNENRLKVDVGQGLEELLMMRESDILWIE